MSACTEVVLICTGATASAEAVAATVVVVLLAIVVVGIGGGTGVVRATMVGNGCWAVVAPRRASSSWRWIASMGRWSVSSLGCWLLGGVFLPNFIKFFHTN